MSLVALASLLAVHGPWTASGNMDGFDVLAPFAGREGAVAPGIAALLAAALLLPARDDEGVLPRCAWGAIVAWGLALGALLRLGGAPALVDGHLVPLPGIALAAVAGGGDASAGAVVVAGVLVAVGLAGGGTRTGGDPARAEPAQMRRVALALGGMALLEGAHVAAATSWTGVPAPGGAALRMLAERAGGLVVLPAAAHGAGASPRAEWLARVTGRPLVRAAGPRDRMHAEPAVVASFAVLTGDASVRVPPLAAGAAFARLGVTDLVVDRRALPDAALARLDPVLALLHGAPQRDHAAGLDVYRVPAATAVGEDVAPLPIVRGAAASGAEGWRTLAELLAGR